MLVGDPLQEVKAAGSLWVGTLTYPNSHRM